MQWEVLYCHLVEWSEPHLSHVNYLALLTEIVVLTIDTFVHDTLDGSHGAATAADMMMDRWQLFLLLLFVLELVGRGIEERHEGLQLPLVGQQLGRCRRQRQRFRDL
jgi:hypothetical protein